MLKLNLKPRQKNRRKRKKTRNLTQKEFASLPRHKRWWLVAKALLENRAASVKVAAEQDTGGAPTLLEGPVSENTPCYIILSFTLLVGLPLFVSAVYQPPRPLETYHFRREYNSGYYCASKTGICSWTEEIENLRVNPNMSHASMWVEWYTALLPILCE